MKNPLLPRNLLFYLFLFISSHLFAQSANNTCATATNLGTISGNMIATPGDLYLANNTNLTGGCGNRADIWYQFTLPAGSTGAIITVQRKPTANQNLADNNTFIEVFNGGTCATATGANSRGCNDISIPRKHTGLTAGGTYFFRINTTASTSSQGVPDYGLNVYCVADNDNCTNTPTVLNPGTSLDGSILGATNSGVAVGTCSGTPDDDVWYRFTAPYTFATLTISNIGANLAASGARMQLFQGTCGALVAVPSASCSGTTNVINATGLTVGATYYVRVYSAGANPQAGTAWGYRISLSPSVKTNVIGSRMNEVYQQQILSAPQILNDPWEITYGPDDNLWITESKGYRVYKMNPTTGVRDTVLDISQGSTFLPVADQVFNCQFANGNGAQGGLAGLAIHPQFLSGQNFVYINYIYSQTSSTVFTNRVVRFTYNSGTGKLGSPVWLCDSIPGSSDHNSQRLLIAPVGGINYLFCAAGDMGAGQFGNVNRMNKAQMMNSYEGKILRFNLVPDADAGNYDKWIPNNNPFNVTLGVQSAVWARGIRNNQGLVYDPILDKMYGSSHGPFSDDEINIIESGKNYGHPLVIGYAADGNANNTTAGAAPNMSPGHPSSCPMITSETANATSLGAAYKDPLFAAYPNSTAFPSLSTLWNTTSGANAYWPSEGWSGLDLASTGIVPGWRKSLIAASLKWGRLVKLRLKYTGDSIVKSGGFDTVSYFGSQNRFRDLAFGPGGKDLYVIMDKSSTTSGPSALNPGIATCGGCVQKYKFLGYADNAGKSSIPTSIDVADGTVNTCNPGTTVTIDDDNNTLWVPITGPDGNIMAEINAMGQNLGDITSSFYKNSGAIRTKAGVRYLDRNMTITPANNSFAIPVKVRLYISKAEFDALDADPLSGLTGTGNIGLLRVLKNGDACGGSVVNGTTMYTPTNSGVDLVHGSNGYILQIAVPGFSTFYFATSNITLPVTLISFTGVLQNNATLLNWETANELNTAHFVVERSIDNASFDAIGTVAAHGTTTTNNSYSYTDNDVTNLPSNVIYYRLKIVDIDGSSKYSNTIVINLADIAGRVSVYPNPATSSIKVTISAAADGKGQWKLTDNIGQVVLQSSATLRKGNNNVVIDINKLAAGVYYLNVAGPGIDQKIKVQKL